MAPRPEVFISVDLETAGPVPSRYSVLSIGACLVEDLESSFYEELRPELTDSTPEALAVSSLSMDRLLAEGTDAAVAWSSFVAWVAEVVPDDHRAVFTAFNAAFDWMFVVDALERHGLPNPFGHAAFDLKAYALGRFDGTWAGTSMRYLSPRFGSGEPLTHHALADARDQAELFRAMREARKESS